MSGLESSELAAILARKAQEDATAVRECSPNSEIADSVVGFHAQQAIEKWLKSVIASQGATFEHTHDLSHLITLAEAQCGEVPFDKTQVIELTEYAVPLRYEDVLDEEPLDREAAVSLVDQVGEWASRLGARSPRLS